MKINIIKQQITTMSGQTLVLFSSNKEKSPQFQSSSFAKELGSIFRGSEYKAQLSECLFFRNKAVANFEHLLFVGLGDLKSMKEDSACEYLRQAGASLVDQSKAQKLKELTIDLDSLPTSLSAKAVQALVEGLMLASYSFDELKTKSKGKTTAKGKDASVAKVNAKASAKGASKPAAIDPSSSEMLVHLVSKDAQQAAIKQAFQNAVIIGNAVNFSRRLGDMPGNLMTPSVLADEVVSAAKGTDLKVTVWNRAQIAKEKMGGLLGVARGSDEEPRFIIMEYKGGGKKSAPIAYVGKGLTFDTGGISIKPSAGMEEMKYDMCGGANVIGTMLAIAKLKLKVNAVGFVPASENMPSGKATKPGDIHIGRNGKSFEVNNTDAEGRLILADALAYASEQKPSVILDAATLTGAMVVALGNIHTGFFTRNKALKDKVEKAAQESGESVWNMPLCDHHTKDMKGTYADLSNTSATKGAGSATAAAFLEQFVGENIPWAHFDIAGTGWHCGNRLNYCPKRGATGVMVRTFVEFAKSHKA